MTTTVHHEGDGLNRKYWNPFLLFVSLFFVWPLCLAFTKVMLLSEPFIFLFHCVSSVTSLKAIWWVWKQDGGSSASSPPFCSDLGSEYQEGRCDCFSRQNNELPPVCRMMIGKGSFISVKKNLTFFWRSSSMKMNPTIGNGFSRTGGVELIAKVRNDLADELRLQRGKDLCPPAPADTHSPGQCALVSWHWAYLAQGSASSGHVGRYSIFAKYQAGNLWIP